MFIKHGDLQPITNVIEASEIIEEAAKEALEKAKKEAKDESDVVKVESKE